MPPEEILFFAGILITVSVLAVKISDRSGIPALVLFLALGMLAGSEGLGRIYFDDPKLALFVSEIALIFILFDGGLNTSWQHVRSSLASALSLATLGVLVTCLLVGLFTYFVFHFSLKEGLLIGAIISSTDAAAVFSVLRANKLGLKGRLQAILELESGCNDPMAIFLTIGFTQLLAHAERPFSSIIPLFFQQIGLGLLGGLLIGWGAVLLVRHLRLDLGELYTVLCVGIALLCYGVTTLVGGSGFLAVYVAAILLNNRTSERFDEVVRFHNGLAWLMQVIMFVTLGLLVFPSRLVHVAGEGILIALFLMFVARPVSVFLALARAKIDWRAKTFISWVGLRGAVPIVLATFPLIDSVKNAGEIFDLIFFIVVASVLFQGTSLPFVAKRLNVLENPQRYLGSE